MEKSKKKVLIIGIVAILVIALIVGIVIKGNQDKKEVQSEEKESSKEESVKKETKELTKEEKRVKEVLDGLCGNLDVGGKSYYLSPYHGCYEYVCYYSEGEAIIFQEDCETELIEEVDNPEEYTVEEYIKDLQDN